MNVENIWCCVCVSYNPREYYEKNADLRQCVDQIAGGFFSPEDHNLFADIINSLMNHDKYLWHLLYYSVFYSLIYKKVIVYLLIGNSRLFNINTCVKVTFSTSEN